MTDSRRYLWLGARICIAVALLAWLSSRIDTGVMLNEILAANHGLLLAALGCFIATHLIISLRWWVLLRFRQVALPIVQVIWINFASLFFALFLPTAAGGDLARVAYAVKSSVDLKNAVNSTLADRVFGLLTLSLMPILPALYYMGKTDGLQRWSSVALVVAGLSLLTIWQLPLLVRLVTKLGSLLSGRLAKAFGHFADWLTDLTGEFSSGRTLWGIVAISLVAHFVMIIGYWFVGKSVLGQADLSHFFLFVPLIVLFTMIPIGINGLGLREVGFAALFSDVGVAEEKAVAVSLLIFAITLVLGAFGGVFAIFDRSGHSSLPMK